MALTTPKAILFDWDNTLVDTWPIIHRALADAFASRRMEPWTMEQVKARVARSMRESFPELFGENWEAAGKIYQDAYRKYQPGLKAFDDTLPMVEALAKLPGLFVGIVSNKKGENLRKELASLGWTKHFKVAVGSEDAARDKPHGDPVLLALKDSGVEIGPEVWFVGDSIIDLECAESAGMTGILYGDVESELGEGRAGRYQEHAFHAHVRNHEELKALMEESGVRF